ncbi:MAG: RHS repeat protein, partial [Elusimicrobia bacterium]|nr:RHS repeat protein [Elusimicrobiota bacterium]
LESVSDNNNRRVLYEYDSSGRLARAVDIDGAPTAYAYDAAGFLSQVSYPNGAHNYIVSDSTGRVVRMYQDGDNDRTDFEYVSGSKTIVTDALNRRTTHETITEADGKTTTRLTDARGNVTISSYDSGLKAESVTDALGRTTRKVYDAKGNLVSVADHAGNTTVMAYTGEMVYEQVYSESTVEEIFLGESYPFNLTGVTDPKGGHTGMRYDANGNLRAVTDALGNVSELSYDQQGHVTGTKDPLNNVSLFNYDTMGALVKVTDPLGRVTSMTRDNFSRVTQTRDPKNKLTLFDYDIKGNLTKVTDAINGITQYTYTGGGCPSCGGAGDLLATVKDAKNQQTTFAYDLQKRLTGVTNPLTQSKNFAYDKKGNLTSVTDAKTQTVTLEYDVLDRLTVKNLTGGEGAVNYAYDGVSNLLSVTSQDSAVSMAYGILNRVDQVRQTVGGQTYTITYAYDANGNRTGMTSPWGTTSYTYDALNRLTSLTNPDAKTITFAYDAAGKRTKMTLPNGTETTYAYDAAGQLLQILHRKTADNTALLFANYAYDPAGNRASMLDMAGTHSYGYDDLHRLISAQHPDQPNETFSYDPVGNRLSDAVLTGYQHNAANRLTENSGYTYTYDANGNLTGQTEKANSAYTAYAYTSENQLKQAAMPGSITAAYKYDPLGRRIEKNVNGTVTRYVYDNEDIIATLDGSNALIAAFTHGPGIDEPLIMKKADTSANYYYHADGLGSITALTDNTGAIVETVEYQAYGKPTIKDRTGAVFDRSTVGNPYLFTAREFDPETGLYYLRARYYNAETGRFLQEDPYYNSFSHSPVDIVSPQNLAGSNRPFTLNLLRVMKYPANFNYFAYALNNPVLFIDPSGLAVCYRITFGLPLYHCVSFSDDDANGVYLLPNAKFLFLNFIDNNYLKSLPKYWPKASCPNNNT